jgi:hypothetical protein
MLDLLAILKEGSTYDGALMEVYGFDIDGLDARWRATLVSYAASADGDRQSRASEIAILAIIATALALWFWRRSSKKSAMRNKP